MDKILSKGFTILNSKPTRQKDTVDGKPACLDLMVTNKFEKIVNHESGLSNFSDHTLQILQRSTSGIKNTQNYMRIRTFKNFSSQEFKINIKNHNLFIETNYEGQIDKISENLQTIIQESIEPLAPIKIIQTSQKKLPKLSEKIKIAMAERDTAFEESKITKNQDDIRNYKNQKNEVNRMIAREKYERTKASLQTEDATINSRWKTVKNFTGQTKNSTPQVIIEDKIHHTTHIGMANALNRLYIKKIKNIKNKMEQTDIDPLTNYK